MCLIIFDCFLLAFISNLTNHHSSTNLDRKSKKKNLATGNKLLASNPVKGTNIANIRPLCPHLHSTALFISRETLLLLESRAFLSVQVKIRVFLINKVSDETNN